MKNYLRVLTYLVSVHLIALLMMSVFRVLFFVAVCHDLEPQALDQWGLIAKGFAHGLWFDNVIACYILALPLVAGAVMGAIGRWKRWMVNALGGWFGTMYTLVFMAEATNIPYYNYFSKPLNASVWNWAEYATTTAGMLFGETSYYLYIFYFFAFTTAFIMLLRRMNRRLWCRLSGTPYVPFNTVWKRLKRRLTKRYGAAEATEAQAAAAHMTAAPQPASAPRWVERGVIAVCFVATGLLCFLGIRGRFGYNPIKVSAAYFCSYPVLNNMGINPMFSFLATSLDELRPERQRLTLMDDSTAVCQVQQLLGRQGIEGISPIARRVTPEGPIKRHNVVLVLMESMSARLMGAFGNTQNLTPNLDSLYNSSLSFANFYSAGNHTNHGLYATLYSFPSIMYRNAMKGSDIPVYSGLPTVLRDHGWQTLFFMTHEGQYDNMNGFFRTNGYDEVYAQENYPSDRVVNSFGVPDDFLFTYALPVLRQRAATGKPFFATLLTISNHPPYCVPADFKARTKEPETQIVEYADACIGNFMAAAEREPWAKNTIFVFLGDHGKKVGTTHSELPDCFNHIPLIIRGPGITPEVRTDFAGQVDVAPTLLGMLNVPYVQNNFGVDLGRERRPAIFYAADKTIAARDSSALFVFNPDLDMEFCYDLRDGQPIKTVENDHFRFLRNYCFSMLQCTEYVVGKRMTTDGQKK